jgi:hypothetical protein
VEQVTATDREAKLAALRRRSAQLRQEEARLGRLYITGKISEAVYEQLWAEWREKVRHAENQLTNLERQTGHYLDDLDAALTLLASAQTLYERLGEQRATLLQILAKRIIVNADGEIIDHELHSPFTYLRTLVANPQMSDPRGYGSTQVRLGAPMGACSVH